jgi:hypothetical protein
VELVSIELLYEKEACYIAKHKTTNEEFGYNKCAVGSGMAGRNHSPETIEKIRVSNSGKTIPQERRDRISATLTGQKLSPERIAKAKARRASPETKALMSESHKIRILKNPDAPRKAAKARWGTKEPLILTTPPIIVTNKRNV